MYNTTPIRKLSQAFVKTPQQETFGEFDSLKKSLGELSRGARGTLDYLVYLTGNCRAVYATQTRIGVNAGVKRETTNRAIRILEKHGLVRSTYRHMTSCLYEVNPLLLGSWRFHFSQWLPSLKGLLLISLLSLGFEQNVTQAKNKEKYIYISSSSYTYYLEKLERQARGIPPGSYKKKLRRANVSEANHIFGPNHLESQAIKVVEAVMPLTRAGKIRLTPFKESVVLCALKDMLASNVEIKSPVKWLFSKCNEISKQCNYRRDYQTMDSMIAFYQIPKDPVLVRGNWTFNPIASKPTAYKKTMPTRSSKQSSRLGYHRDAEPVKIRVIDPVADYLRFKEVNPTPNQFTHFAYTALRNKVDALNLSNQELQDLGLGELCQSPTSSPESPVLLPRESMEKKSSHPLESEKSSGISTWKASMTTDQPTQGHSTWKSLSSSTSHLMSML